MSAVIKDPAQQNNKTLVSLRNLNKHYGDFAAVDNISLDIQDGEFLTFLGSSGSGKSTTLSMLAGFETPSSGEILVSGQSLVNVPPHKRDIGMVFQRYSTCSRTCRCATTSRSRWRFANWPAPSASVGSMRCSNWCNWNSSPIAALRQLSGGQQQRVGDRSGAGVRTAHPADGRTPRRTGQKAARGSAR
ncbi:ATP-binding cassette domain-containing protein [Pseudomonas sp. 10S4]|uniref:ATP-binding cassette domain-containing protein n=1 Tax=Pseudomonas sp. 10S4 TaxID=3048583 RepID=UPI002AC98970|nr:ATP-binding cassette domain-containing protein [Pseudomonas sp. 10S4]WPX16425.1 ATP-binding cassette domain-containing protein [Pseudomonas sp. 10S4]